MLKRAINRQALQKNLGFFKQSQRSFGAGNSLWSKIDSAPPDPILGLNDAFKKDTDPKKVLLGMGAYRDNDGKPLILGCVKKAEEMLLAKGVDHEYAGINGIPSYN
jgi:aspartate aminotransferase